MKLWPTLLFFISATPLFACLWDRDTIAMEAKGRLEVVETAVGWFDRLPPEYYQMRLDRVTSEVLANPARLELYDDAAVACDRLGWHEEAVDWMTRKQTAMASLPESETTDHRYRMHANLGVFRTHQWIKTIDRETHPAFLDQAIQEVSTALAINPNAHFGREHAHLVLLEWWKNGLAPKPAPEREADRRFHRSAGMDFSELARGHPDTDFVKAFCGLIQMGSASDSIDVHTLLMSSLLTERAGAGERHSSLGLLASYRVAELLQDSRKPIHAGLQSWIEWRRVFELPAENNHSAQLETIMLAHALQRGANPMDSITHDPSVIGRYFHEAREAARIRHENKTAFMLAQFKQGRHPDTHADFWNGWTEPAMPPLPAQSDWEKRAGMTLGPWIARNERGLLDFAVFTFPSLLLLAIIGIVWRRRRKQASSEA